MKTSIMGGFKWNNAIKNKWDGGKISSSNYFKPRPYVNEYGIGSKTEGFTFIHKSEDGNYNIVTQVLTNE